MLQDIPNTGTITSNDDDAGNAGGRSGDYTRSISTILISNPTIIIMMMICIYNALGLYITCDL